MYTEWMKSKGAHFEKVDLKYFYKAYRGLVAKVDIAKGDDIIFVPQEITITRKKASEAPIGRKLTEKNANLTYPHNATISTFILSEMKKPKSDWDLLIKAMPISVDNFPLYYTKEERELLRGSPFLSFFRR